MNKKTIENIGGFFMSVCFSLDKFMCIGMPENAICNFEKPNSVADL